MVSGLPGLFGPPAVLERAATVTGLHRLLASLDLRAAGELRALLSAVAAYAAGGRPALEARGDAGARQLLLALGGR